VGNEKKWRSYLVKIKSRKSGEIVNARAWSVSAVWFVSLEEDSRFNVDAPE